MQIHKLGNRMKDLYLKPKYTKPYLQSGRMVTVKNGTDDFGWGVIVKFEERQVKNAMGGKKRGGEEKRM